MLPVILNNDDIINTEEQLFQRGFRNSKLLKGIYKNGGCPRAFSSKLEAFSGTFRHFPDEISRND